MLLKKLEIERQSWGDYKGKCVGKITFEGNDGSVALNLNPASCEKLFLLVADGLIDVAKETAENMTCNLIEQKTAIESK